MPFLRPLALCVLLACGCAEAPPPPPNAPTSTESSTSAPIVGRWVEHMDGRDGCADRIAIDEKNGALSVVGADCNDDKPYETVSSTFDGKELRVTFRVGSTGYVVRYRLVLDGGALRGTSAVTPPGGATSTYDVQWTRVP